MKLVILAGGRGTRLAELTEVLPKPMVEIGGRPILWHIMNIYAAHDCREFIVACGYRGEVIKEYFNNFFVHNSDYTIDLRNGELEILNSPGMEWTVSVVDTGQETMTGGRIRRLAPLLRDDTFMVTYGDGVGDIDVGALLRTHRQAGRLATVTAVRPPARFGALDLDDDAVLSFSEKPQAGAGWINGGFFVFEPEVLDYLEGDDTVLERRPLEKLAADGQLTAYRHPDFWQPMDTLRDKRTLDRLWSSGEAPWKVW